MLGGPQRRSRPVVLSGGHGLLEVPQIYFKGSVNLDWGGYNFIFTKLEFKIFFFRSIINVGNEVIYGL